MAAITDDQEPIEAHTRRCVVCHDESIRWADVSTTHSWLDNGLLDYTVEIFHDVTELVDKLAAAAESEQRFRLLVENTIDVVFHTVGGVLEWISPSLTAVTGWEPADLIGHATQQLWHPDDLNKAIALRDVTYLGRGGAQELRLRCKDGSYTWFEAVLQPCIEPDGRTGAVGVLRNVTDRVVARQDWADAIEAQSDPFVRLGALRDPDEQIVDFVYLDANIAAADAAGLRRDQLVGSTVMTVSPDDSGQRLVALCRGVVEGGGPLSIDGAAMTLPTIPGATFHDIRATRAGDGVALSYHNATDRIVAAENLAASEARFRLLAENATDIVYQNDLSGTIVWISPGLRDTLGWDPAELVGTRSMDLVHPDDRESISALKASLLAEGEDSGVLQARYQTRAGDYVWMSVRAHPVRDDNGNSSGLVVGLRDVHDERAARDELTFLAYHDPLTGLRNRAWILDTLDRDLAAARRDGSRLGVFFLDLDNFKVVNDSLGHVVGDDILGAIAHRISVALRPGDRIGRFGGDEFVVIAPGVHTDQDADTIARRICSSVVEEVTASGRRVTISTSIGIAISDPSSTSTSMLRDADAALHRAKASGRSRWEIFNAEMHTQAMDRLVTEEELRAAIIERQFVVHYQPIVSLIDSTTMGYEALVRWQHPEHGLLGPAKFLSIAEASGLIVEIGHQVLEQVCEMLASRPDVTLPISVNMSPVEIDRLGWHVGFLDRLYRHGVSPQRIIVEVTETAMLSVLERTKSDLTNLLKQGVGIHVDDFGTGYSSIALLRDLPVTGVKLDLSFTSHLTTDETARALAAGLSGLIQGLSLDGIAEGIETTEQAEILLAQGWVHGQGYLYGRPGPIPPA